MDEAIKLYASFDDGKLVIERQDGEPISIIMHDEVDGEALEVLEFGANGNAVKAMQSLLNCHRQHLNVDGVFGNLTQTALIIFQDERKITGDNAGVCGFITWNELIKR